MANAGSLMLMVTNACNFNCQHCLRETRTPEHLDVDLIDSILEEAKRQGVNFVGLTGGEPILHPQFARLVEVVTQHGLDYGLNTNGWRYDLYAPVIDKFGPPRNVGISIDGATAAVHDKMRRPGSWKKATEGISYFVSRGIPVSVTTLINRYNINELEDIVVLAQEIGAFHIRFAGLIPTDDVPDDMYLSKEEMAEARKRAIAIAKERCYEVRQVSSFRPIEELHYCSVVTMNQPAINARGEMVFCCDTIGRGAVVGSLKEHSYSELLSRVHAAGERIIQHHMVQRASGNFSRCYNRCAYCNKFFAKNDHTLSHW